MQHSDQGLLTDLVRKGRGEYSRRPLGSSSFPDTELASERRELAVRIQSVFVRPGSYFSQLDHMRRVLRLDPEVQEFRIVFGMLPKERNEIAFRTRSVLRILTFLALNVEVPEDHLADGRTLDLGLGDTDSPAEPQLTVHSSCKEPCDAFAAVHYQGYWFWIDQRDFRSKRTMLYLKVLLALADTKQQDAAPALTIRAN